MERNGPKIDSNQNTKSQSNNNNSNSTNASAPAGAMEPKYPHANPKQERHPNEGIYRNPRFMNASNTILGCPVVLKLKSNNTFHGIFVTFSPEFDVLLECCHQVDPANEVVIYGRSLPKKASLNAMYFERENIVEMTALEVDKDFALKSAESNFTDAAISQKAQTQGKGPYNPNASSNDAECGKELEAFDDWGGSDGGLEDEMG